MTPIWICSSPSRSFIPPATPTATNITDTATDSTDQTYWIDDPDSQFYNRRVEGTDNQDWKSAEHMSTISGYQYGFVINYNMPAEYNKGSAIFFHIGGGPTQGCVATSEDMVLAYLAKLNASENPYILVI